MAITVVLAAVLYILVTGLLGGHTSVTSAITMTATTGGTCTLAGASGGTLNTYSVSIGGATQTVTTANFAVSLTQAGATAASAPGTAAAAAATSTCYAAPVAGGWTALLIPAGSTGSNWAIYSGSGWQECTGSPAAPCSALSTLGTAVTVSGGMTLVITAGLAGASNTPPAVSLTQASIGVYGTNGATVTGSVTL